MILKPSLLSLPKVAGKSGFLTYMDEAGDLPIPVKRMYWIYDVETGGERGNHAHINSDRVLVCMQGSLEIKIEDTAGDTYEFFLDDPSKAVVFPRYHWINIRFAKDSMLLVACSCLFKEDLLITDYNEFKRLTVQEKAG